MHANTLDINSKDYPARELKNTVSQVFILDGITCVSFESFLQATKFEKSSGQVIIAGLLGIQAVRQGKEQNKNWKTKNTLWWNGIAYDRSADSYQRLIDRALLQRAIENESFQQALLASGDLIITHLAGKTKQAETPLTGDELCKRLMKLRNILRKNISLNTLKRI